MPLMRAPCLFLATVLAAPLAFAGTEQDPLNVFNESTHWPYHGYGGLNQINQLISAFLKRSGLNTITYYWIVSGTRQTMQFPIWGIT